MSFLRNRLTRNIGLLVGVGAAMAGGLAARDARADVVVSTVAATKGQHGSNWQSDLKLTNPYTETISYTLVFTPRGQSMSDGDPRVAYTLGPNETQVLSDAYHVGFPGQSGVARVLVQMDNDPNTGQKYPNPVVDPAVFNDAGNGAEFGQSPAVYTVEQLEAANGTYRAIVGKEGERTNPAFTTGSLGATVTVTARGPAGGDPLATQTVTLGPNGYFQWSGNPDGVAALMGTAIPANSTLDYVVEGTAIPDITITNNVTNDSRWKDATKYTQITPTILGIDWNNDGVADDVDADHNGVLDTVINVSCSAPFPWQGKLITQPSGSYSYVAADLPQGMGIDQGTGQIGYQPPCSTFFSSFTPRFYAMGNGQQTPIITAVFNVTR